jgi:exonuclease III
MKIATFNMRNFYDAGTFVDSESEEAVTEDFFNERVTYFTEFFRPLDLDVICLQEVGGEHGVTRIGDGLGYNYFFARPNKRGIRKARSKEKYGFVEEES